MEDHPIPQDVTGFQFKLIGNMTIKQFSYLITGIVFAWLILQMPIFFIIKFPISVFFAVVGISLAYLPVEGRPLDAMISHFIKALISPTQFVYQKAGGQLYFPSIHPAQKKEIKKLPPSDNDRLKMYLRSLPRHPGNKLDDKEANFLASLSNLTSASQKAIAPSPKNQPMPRFINPPTPAPMKANNPKSLVNKPQIPTILEKPPEPIKIQIPVVQKQTEQKQSEDLSHKKVSELESKLQEVNSQKEQLAQELLSLRQKMETKPKNVFTPSTAVPKTETKNVIRIPQNMGKNIGLPITPSAPNLVTGIVKDSRDNMLANILVEVKDKEGNPVRAFKTNELGRFISATPLINGIYTIEFEDPRKIHKFDAVEITVKGDIIMPLEVVSIDTREELRKSLFGDK
ncbi:MAG: PrgI family protein [Candidatus Levybacteria bacterium]|nr:PrgI family protein [Candidatus Levybacteria bacterium]